MRQRKTGSVLPAPSVLGDHVVQQKIEKAPLGLIDVPSRGKIAPSGNREATVDGAIAAAEEEDVRPPVITVQPVVQDGTPPLIVHSALAPVLCHYNVRALLTADARRPDYIILRDLRANTRVVEPLRAVRSLELWDNVLHFRTGKQPLRKSKLDTLSLYIGGIKKMKRVTRGSCGTLLFH